MECSEVKKLIAGYIDHSLSEELVQEIEEHLCVCETCRLHLSKLLENKSRTAETNAEPVSSGRVEKNTPVGNAGKKAFKDSITFAEEETSDQIKEQQPAVSGEENLSKQDTGDEEGIKEQPKPKKVSNSGSRQISQYVIMAAGVIIVLILIVMFLNYQQIR